MVYWGHDLTWGNTTQRVAYMEKVSELTVKGLESTVIKKML
jgi:DNA-binding CsgD family transcriptional regulator